MNINPLLLLFCGFIIGTATGSSFAMVRGKRNLGRLRLAFVRQLTAIGKRCATALDPEPGRIRITEAPDVVDYGAMVRRLRTPNRAAAHGFPPVVSGGISHRPSAP